MVDFMMFINASINNSHAKPLDGFVFGQNYVKSPGSLKQRLRFFDFIDDPEGAYQVAIRSYKPCTSLNRSIENFSWFTSFQCALLKISDQDNKQYDVLVNINSLSKRLGIQRNKIVEFAKHHNHDVTALVSERLKELLPPPSQPISSATVISIEEQQNTSKEPHEEPSFVNSNDTELVKQELKELPLPSGELPTIIPKEENEIILAPESNEEQASVNSKATVHELEKVEGKKENKQFLNAIPLAAALFASHILLSNLSGTYTFIGASALGIGFCGVLDSAIKIFYNEERRKNFVHLSLYSLTLGLGIYEAAMHGIPEVDDSELNDYMVTAATLSGKLANMCSVFCPSHEYATTCEAVCQTYAG